MMTGILSAPLLKRVGQELEWLYGDRLERVLLFGSRAWGEARPDSDWDVAVFIRGYDGAIGEYHRLAELGYDLLLDTGEALSLKPFAPEGMEERTPLMHEIRRDGIPV